jgi:hypothetical protein
MVLVQRIFLGVDPLSDDSWVHLYFAIFANVNVVGWIHMLLKSNKLLLLNGSAN